MWDLSDVQVMQMSFYEAQLMVQMWVEDRHSEADIRRLLRQVLGDRPGWQLVQGLRCLHWMGRETQSEGEMRNLEATDFAHVFLWLTTLVAAIILFWGSDRLWMMVVILLASGWTSIGLVSRRCGEGD